MFNKNILASLVGIVFVLSLVVIQQQASAQWTPPSTSPGSGDAISPLTNPVKVDLQLDGDGEEHSVTGIKDIIDARYINATKVTGTQLCIGTTSPVCKSAWPGGDVTNPMTAELKGGGWFISNLVGLKEIKPNEPSFAIEATAADNSRNPRRPEFVSTGLYAKTLLKSGEGFSYAVYGLSQNDYGTGIYGAASRGWAGYFAGNLGASYAYFVDNPETEDKEGVLTVGEICLGPLHNEDCREGWPAGGGGTLTGGGTTNYLSKWSGNTSLNNSVIYQTSDKIGIGTTSLDAKLQVNPASSLEGINIKLPASNPYSALVVKNSAGSDLFRVTEDGEIRVVGGNPGAGKVLTSDANGWATWETASGGLPAGISGQTLRYDNSNNLVANSVLYNNGSNIGINYASPDVPLTFAEAVGQKIHLYGGQANGYVIGVETNGATGILRLATGTGVNDLISFITGGYNGVDKLVINPTVVDVTDGLNVGSSDRFQVNSTGNLVKVNNVAYSWPAAQGAGSTYLMNNGGGTLSWAGVTASSMPWSGLTGFPAACSAGQYVTAVGSTLTCSTPPAGGSSLWTANGSNIYYNSGNVGIGVASPGSKLQVVGDISLSGGSPNKVYSSGGSDLRLQSSNEMEFMIMGGTIRPISIYETGKIAMGNTLASKWILTVDPDARCVGINEGNCTERLHIDTSNLANNVTSEVFRMEGYGRFVIDKAGNGSLAKLVVGGNGDVGININRAAEPGYKLDIEEGSTDATQGTDTNIINIDNVTNYAGHNYYIWTGTRLARHGTERWFIGMDNTSSGKLLFRRAGSSNAIVIDTSGNVGIGTETPTAKLDVSGTIKANSRPVTTWVAVANGATCDTTCGGAANCISRIVAGVGSACTATTGAGTCLCK